MNLKNEQWVEMLNQIREAKTKILRDAECFHESSIILEHMGQLLKQKQGNGLGAYKEEIVALAQEGKSLTEADEEVERLFDVVKSARNTLVHEGAFARHLSTRLLDLLLLLEAAIMKKLLRVGDLMVRSPVATESWHTLSQARRLMLSNSFSHLPVWLELGQQPQWYFISDTGIVRFFAQSNKKGRDELLVKTIEETKENLNLLSPRSVDKDALISELAFDLTPAPILITENGTPMDRLIGIISPFDLL